MNKVDPFELPPMSDVSDLETKKLPDGVKTPEGCPTLGMLGGGLFPPEQSAPSRVLEAEELSGVSTPTDFRQSGLVSVYEGKKPEDTLIAIDEVFVVMNAEGVEHIIKCLRSAGNLPNEYQAGYDDGFAAGYEQARMDATKPKDFDPAKTCWNGEFWEDIKTGEKVFDADDLVLVLKEEAEAAYSMLFGSLCKAAVPGDDECRTAEAKHCALDWLGKGGSYGLPYTKNLEDAKDHLVFWMLKNAKAGAYCSPSWGRNFSEQAAVFFDTGRFYDIHATAEERDAFYDAKKELYAKYRGLIEEWKARQ